jgi:hypothetical protein
MRDTPRLEMTDVGSPTGPLPITMEVSRRRISLRRTACRATAIGFGQRGDVDIEAVGHREAQRRLGPVLLA